MNLSNRLTFSLVFSVLLVALFAFIATPAMAAQETITYFGTLTPAGEEAAGKWEVTFKFSEGGSFSKVNFTSTTTTDDETPVTTINYNISLGGVALTKEQFDAATYSGNKLTVAIPAGASGPTLGFTVTGFEAVETPAATILEVNAVHLMVLTDHLGPREYRVYARVAGDQQIGAPQLRTGVEPEMLENFPDDLDNFFEVEGGTIDLNITGTAKNSKRIIINEVMWAVDNSRSGQTGEFNQQWIEVYNKTSIPVADTVISFNFIDNTFPPPAIKDGTADRLSNIAGRQNIWDVKGSREAAATRNVAGDMIIGADPVFASMYRNLDKQKADGWQAGHWTVSDRPYFPGFMGTPGSENKRAGLPTARANPSAYTPPKDKVIINEVGNYVTNDLDWIELRNVSSDEVNIKDWHLTRTDGINRREVLIVKFPEIKIPAGEVLLIVNKDPIDTNLIAGQDIRESDAANQAFGAGPHKYLNIKRSHNPKTLYIPTNMTKGFLMLRSHKDAKFFEGRQHLHDVAGTSRVSHNSLELAANDKESQTGNFWKTSAWPINGHTGNNYRAHNAKDSSNSNASLDPNANFKNDSVWARSGTAHGWRKGGGSHAGFSGGIGYDRGVKGNGTPGYHNDVVKGKTTDLTDGRLIISEIMLTTNNGRAPQWIELQNTSRTKGIDLSYDIDEEAEEVIAEKVTGWQMIIENHNSGSWQADDRPVYITLNLKDLGDIKYIPPNQTVLIASNRTSRYPKSSDITYFPSHRIASIWGSPKAVRDAFGMKNSKSLILNADSGFYIKIVDGAGNVSDEIGNLDGKQVDFRKDIGIDDAYSWHWPTDLTEDGNRTSLIRLMDGGTRGVQGVSAGTVGTPRVAVPDRTVDNDLTGAVLPMDARTRGASGTSEYAKYAWVPAFATGLNVVEDTYYGSQDDYSTPLHTTGTPLPVSLSYFRPTLENGAVVIRWTTESELDNAGFNILRSDSRHGEFKQVNSGLVQGAGTTGERNTYKWVDESAKPGVVYYYQIEDVSFAGEHQTLTTTKLKGLISANNKLTTLWGGLKSQQD